MKLNQRTALALSLFFGLATAALVYFVLNRPTSVAAQRGTPRVSVVVAANDISPRTTIQPHMVKRESFEQGQEPNNALKDFNGVYGKVALRQISAGQALTGDDVAEKGPGLGMSYVVEPNMRALTVPIDPVSGVAGFLKPGDRVDVLATYSANNVNVTKVVMQNLKLLAIGSEPTTTANAQKESNTAKADAPTATLLVSSEQMETLALVAAKAKLHLALRSDTDNAVVPPAPITTTRVFGVNENPGASIAAPAAPAPSPTVIQYAPPQAPSAPRPAPAARPPAPRPAPAKPAPAKEPQTITVTRGTDTSTVQVP